MEVIPHQGSGIGDGAYAEAYQFQVPWTAVQTGVQEGTIAPVFTPFEWNDGSLAFSSLKVNAKTGDLMLRWYNLAGNDAELNLSTALPATGAYKSDILETEGARLELAEGGNLSLAVKPYEIVTLGVRAAR